MLTPTDSHTEPQSSQDILEQQLAMLEIEREEDLRQYRENVLKRSLKERVKKGSSWYPVQLNRSYIGTAERIVIEIERNPRSEGGNVLQSGSAVVVFGMSGGKEVGQTNGVVYSIRKDRMKVVLSTTTYPFWLPHSQLGVNLDFDDRSYREMKAAVKKAKEAQGDRLAEIRELILGNSEPQFGVWDYTYGHPILNRSQEKAIQRILEAKDIAVIHGPPGTGKTTTLVQAIVETLKREQQVLVCAPSNTAVDLLTLRCAEEGIDVLRMGNPARVDEQLHYNTLDETITRHPDFESLKKIRKESENLYKQANKHKKRFGRLQHDQRRSLRKEARDFKQYAQTLEEYILNQVLEKAQVITCTLTGAAHRLISRRKYNTVFIDEAAQALSPSCWIPIARAHRVVFAGDHFQLPPTVKSFEAEKGGLARTLLEELLDRKPIAVMLNEQYRMNEQIMRFSGRWFYEDQLHAALEVKHRSLGEAYPALEFIDTAGCGFQESKNAALSTFNADEAGLLLRHLAKFLNQLETDQPMLFESSFSIGIISPYKAQVRQLDEQISASPMLSAFDQYLSVNTVDGFQGQERDVIYISLVRSNDKGEIGFLKDIRRMNVALTRARKKLVVIGDSATLGKHPFYQGFLDYIDEIGAYHSAWEYGIGEA